MNIIITSFEGSVDKTALERAFKGLELNLCISVTNKREVIPDLNAKEHLWMEERPLREGHFTDTNWNTIAPLDEELIERMRPFECVFMEMVGKYVHRTRFKLSGDMPYGERRRQYFSHLRYWNDFLDTRKINLVLMYHMPHKCYDYILYSLCKTKGIHVLYLEHLQAIDSIFVVRDWEDSVVEIGENIRRFSDEYADPEKPIPLSDNYQWYFEYFRREHPVVWYKPRQDGLVRRNFLLKWRKKALKVFKRNPRTFFQSVLSRQFWSHKLQQHRTIRFYDDHAKLPDLSRPFVYAPLHYQPEASTVPGAGAYADQERVIQLIAANLPKNVAIYIKEHPAQGERCRSIAFYKTLLAVPSVTFVPREMDTFQLIDHAVAIATGGGTAGFEGFMRQKPVLMFGHYYYQFAQGVHRIRTAEECKKAIDAIFAGKATISERQIRIFLKAIEECATPYPGPPDSPFEKYSQDEKTTLWAELIGRNVRQVMALLR
ncbi:hypothetical protein HYW84_02295 [Candidatus Peregrinibacteria bacterium]|nr:hypothetical protein [Candidatus Peregrinibacteria bacterium]